MSKILDNLFLSFLINHVILLNFHSNPRAHGGINGNAGNKLALYGAGFTLGYGLVKSFKVFQHGLAFEIAFANTGQQFNLTAIPR